MIKEGVSEVLAEGTEEMEENLTGLIFVDDQNESFEEASRGDCATCDQLCAEPPLSLPHLTLTHSDSSSRPSSTTRAIPAQMMEQVRSLKSGQCEKG